MLKSLFRTTLCAALLLTTPMVIHGNIDIANPTGEEWNYLPKVDETRFKGAVEPGIPIREPDMQWVESTLAAMTLEQKIGQMFVSSQHSVGESLIDNYHIGGFIFIGNGQSAATIVSTVNRLQNYSPAPLWFSIDSEAGVGSRVADATIFPLLMSFGAANDPELTEMCGRITARESQALGLQVTYGPVVDANTEPLNPIISTRSYSDDPERLINLARGFVHGARAEGVLCTFKHYPGHGATAGDSHSSLPGVNLTIEQIEATHIRPYRELAASADVDFVMTAHVWYSQVHPGTPWPATLSTIFNTDILRTSIGYNGILISDSYDMTGLAIAVPDEGERAVRGIESGLDIILHTQNIGAGYNGIRNAVLGGRITEQRINTSVRRILIAKSRAGLPERRTVDPTAWQAVLNHPEHRAVVEQVCAKAFTCAKNTLPGGPAIRTNEKVLVVTLSATQRIFYRYAPSYFTDPFTARVPDTTLINASTSVTTNARNQILAAAAASDKVIVAGYDWWSIASATQVSLIQALTAANTPVIYIGFGAPYHYRQIPEVDAFYCGYSSVPAMQAVAVDVLLGDKPARGVLPVTAPGLATCVSAEGWAVQ